MQRKIYRKENFKILEYTELTMITPYDEKYDFTMIFFAGFNENASKYLYLLKSFFEDYNYKIRIVIPNMPIYTVENQNPNPFFSFKKKIRTYFSWYDIKQNDGKIEIKFNEEKDNFIIDLIRKEINYLEGDTQKLIFAGFSMGGRYALHILTKMKIKVAFIAIFKSSVVSYDNPWSDLQDKESVNFMQNQFHLYISLNDKVINLPRSFLTLDTFKRCKFKFTVKVDNKIKHKIDLECLDYLESLIFNYFYKNLKPKF